MQSFLIRFRTVLKTPDLIFACMDADYWASGSRWRRISAEPL
jgi:hypothetical protein